MKNKGFFGNSNGVKGQRYITLLYFENPLLLYFFRIQFFCSNLLYLT